MSRELYEEALADAKKIKEVAEDNAKRALVEAALPRIRKLVEQALDVGDMSDDDMLYDDHFEAPGEEIAVLPVGDDSTSSAISMPDEEGKVTLDLDQLDANDSDEFELSLESLEALAPLAQTKKITGSPELNKQISSLHESLKSYSAVSAKIMKTNSYKNQISKMISNVENMYDYVQESVDDPSKKKIYEKKLESLFQNLTKLQEQAMPKTRKNRLNEADDDMDLDLDDSGEDMGDDVDLDDDGGEGDDGEITLKLTGLPDDVDLDDLGVDLISGGDDDVDMDDDLDVGGDEDFGDEDSGGDDLDLDLDDSDEETNEMMDLSDDTVVEIDESVLRRELNRAKRLRESVEGDVDTNGHGVGPSEFDDFGGGHDDGEAFLDGEVTTEGEDDMDEDCMSEAQARRKLRVERKIQERARTRIAALKREARVARPAKRAAIARQIRTLSVKINESVVRSRKVRRTLSESFRSAGLNNRRPQRVKPSSDRRAVNNLRAKLSEKNLETMKLKYTNKLLQNENLSKKQKSAVIDRLDEAKTPREVKLVYESVAKTLARQPLRESRGSRGSSSRVTRPAASTQVLNEGFETERWAKLAGITK